MRRPWGTAHMFRRSVKLALLSLAICWTSQADAQVRHRYYHRYERDFRAEAEKLEQARRDTKLPEAGHEEFIKSLQTALKAAGCYVGEINGRGEDTRDALDAWRRQLGFQPVEAKLEDLTVGNAEFLVNWIAVHDSHACHARGERDGVSLAPENGNKAEEDKPPQGPNTSQGEGGVSFDRLADHLPEERSRRGIENGLEDLLRARLVVPVF